MAVLGGLQEAGRSACTFVRCTPPGPASPDSCTAEFTLVLLSLGGPRGVPWGRRGSASLELPARQRDPPRAARGRQPPRPGPGSWWCSRVLWAGGRLWPHRPGHGEDSGSGKSVDRVHLPETGWLGARPLCAQEGRWAASCVRVRTETGRGGTGHPEEEREGLSVPCHLEGTHGLRAGSKGQQGGAGGHHPSSSNLGSENVLLRQGV